MAGEEITYESLVNRWRREVTTGPTELTRIHPAFYNKVEAYLQELQEDYQREHKINPTSGKAMILRDELFNMRKALEDIYDQRERKVVLSALAAARGSNTDKTNMTEGERDLFERLVRALKEGRRSILRRHDRDLGVDAPKAQPAPDVEPEAPEVALSSYEGDPPTPPEPTVEVDEATEPPTEADPTPEPPGSAVITEPSQDAEAAEPPEPASTGEPAEDQPADEAADLEEPAPAEDDGLSSGRVVVQVLEDVPEFTASDMRTYRLRPQDIAALPESAAQALVDRGKARLVTGSAD